MAQPNLDNWTRAGLIALPVYGLLTLWATFTHQPDPGADFGAYAEYVSSGVYLANHLVGSVFGTVLAIFGAVSLGAFLAGGGTGRTALLGMVTGVAGNALILTIFGMSTFATPAVGRAYLAGQEEIVAVNGDILGIPLIVTALLGGLLYSASTVLFGVAVWRSGALPRWAGALYAPTGFLISILGLMIGGSQTVGSALLIAGTVWICYSALRRSTPTSLAATSRSRVR